MVLVGDVHHLEKRLSDFLGVTRTHSCRSGPKYQCCGLAVCVLLVLKIWWRVKVFAGLCIIVFIICVYIHYRSNIMLHNYLVFHLDYSDYSIYSYWVTEAPGSFHQQFVGFRCLAASGWSSCELRWDVLHLELEPWTIQWKKQQDSSFHMKLSS